MPVYAVNKKKIEYGLEYKRKEIQLILSGGGSDVSR